jgi:molecular chaperone DnaK
MVHQVEKTLKESGDKVPAEDKAAAEQAIAAARTALEGDNAEAIKTAGDNLTQAAMKMGEAIYKTEQAAPQGEAPPGPDAATGGRPGDKVVDADFEEVKDKNKPA